MIVATAEATGRSDRQAFDVFAQHVPTEILKCRERPEELRLVSAGRIIRLHIASGTLLEGPVRLSFHLAGTRHLSIRLRALRAFDHYLRRGQIPSPPVPFAPASKRMAMMLATLDGLARGWSQKRIAAALFGDKAVATDWGGQSDFLKSRVRRLIRQAEALGEGGYLGLLQR